MSLLPWFSDIKATRNYFNCWYLNLNFWRFLQLLKVLTRSQRKHTMYLCPEIILDWYINSWQKTCIIEIIYFLKRHPQAFPPLLLNYLKFCFKRCSEILNVLLIASSGRKWQKLQLLCTRLCGIQLSVQRIFWERHSCENYIAYTKGLQNQTSQVLGQYGVLLRYCCVCQLQSGQLVTKLICELEWKLLSLMVFVSCAVKNTCYRMASEFSL